MARFGQTFTGLTSLSLCLRSKYGPSNLGDILHSLAPMQSLVHLSLNMDDWILSNYIEGFLIRKPVPGSFPQLLSIKCLTLHLGFYESDFKRKLTLLNIPEAFPNIEVIHLRSRVWTFSDSKDRFKVDKFKKKCWYGKFVVPLLAKCDKLCFIYARHRFYYNFQDESKNKYKIFEWSRKEKVSHPMD